MVAEMLLHNASEFLALLCLAGMIATVIRWPSSGRRAFLFAFGLFLAGTMLREIVVWWFGARAWPDDAIHMSSIGRIVQITGSVLFVRAALVRYCGEWGWMLVCAVAAAGAWLL